MPKTRPPYAPEFPQQMIELVRSGRDPTDLACEFEPSAPPSATGSPRLTAAMAGARRGPRSPMLP